MPWESLDPCRQWPAGQPVTLQTQGITHLCWVRLTGTTFAPRWLAPLGSMNQRRVHPRELTTRDPRVFWRDGFELQLAIALLSADGDPRCAWLQGPYADDEPELEALHALAIEELEWRPAPPLTAEPWPSAEPRPRRGWLRHELDAFAALAAEVETVDLAPGR